MKGDVLHNVDFGKLSKENDKPSIKDFYLSPYQKRGEHFEQGNTFVYNAFMLAFYQKGSIRLRVNGKPCKVCAPAVFMLLPDQFLGLEERSADCERVSIHVSPEVVMGFPSPVNTEILHMAMNTPALKVSEEQMSRLAAYYRFIELQYNEHEGIYRREILVSLFYALLLEVLEISRTTAEELAPTPKPRRERLCDDFFSLLVRHHRQKRSVAFYADHLHLTPKHLSREIKRITGRTVLYWINQVAVTEIKKQLLGTNATVTEIAEEMDFSSPSALVQYFKLHTGITPLQYRGEGVF